MNPPLNDEKQIELEVLDALSVAARATPTLARPRLTSRIQTVNRDGSKQCDNKQARAGGEWMDQCEEKHHQGRSRNNRN